MQQPGMALVQAAAAKGLRYQRVESQQHAHSKHSHREVEHAANAHASDGFRTDTTHHDRVDNSHHHPADLGKNDWPGQLEHRPEFRPQILPGNRHLTNSNSSMFQSVLPSRTTSRASWLLEPRFPFETLIMASFTSISFGSFCVSVCSS